MKLQIQNIYKSFSNTQVLHGISFNVESGKALGLLGRNGAGKTTTIRIIMDLFKADMGKILLNGEEFNPRDYHIGYLPEERGLYPKKKVLEQLIYLGELRGLSKKKAKENTLHWLERLGVDIYKDKKLDTLSKGNQQKVQLAETFLTNPDIIILDEPFSGLDPVNSQILKDIITEQIDSDKLLIFSSHQMNYVEEFCEEIALIDRGSIVLTGNLKEIKREYGRDRLSISVLDYSLDELKEVFKRDFDHIIRVIHKKKDYLLLELIDNHSKNEFLEEIAKRDIDIERFSTYEPSLEDIFVQRVGEDK